MILNICVWISVLCILGTKAFVYGSPVNLDGYDIPSYVYHSDILFFSFHFMRSAGFCVL